MEREQLKGANKLLYPLHFIFGISQQQCKGVGEANRTHLHHKKAREIIIFNVFFLLFYELSQTK